jgi:hypothetical protein
MAPALLALALASAPALDHLARTAVEAAVSAPDARAELVGIEGAPARCLVSSAEVPQPIRASGRASLRLRGRDAAGQACDAWAWARVRVSGPSLVTSRAISEGEPLLDGVKTEQRELEPGRDALAELPEGARAAKALASGTPLNQALIRVGPLPGEAVSVSLQLGALRVDEVARATPCRAGRACAILPSGRRVEGIWHDGRIVIESP